MDYVKNVLPDGILEIECYKSSNDIELFCRCYSTDYCHYTPEDLVDLYRSFGLSRRSAKYVIEQFAKWYGDCKVVW